MTYVVHQDPDKNFLESEKVETEADCLDVIFRKYRNEFESFINFNDDLSIFTIECIIHCNNNFLEFSFDSIIISDKKNSFVYYDDPRDSSESELNLIFKQCRNTQDAIMSVTYALSDVLISMPKEIYNHDFIIKDDFYPEIDNFSNAEDVLNFFLLSVNKESKNSAMFSVTTYTYKNNKIAKEDYAEYHFNEKEATSL